MGLIPMVLGIKKRSLSVWVSETGYQVVIEKYTRAVDFIHVLHGRTTIDILVDSFD
jgi:hypothetical protein